ncbi:MAG: hypothetical protein ACJ77Y_08520 [Chloroflexota bacterium]
MRRIAALVGAVAMVMTVGVSAVAAFPGNENVRAIPGADCDGQTVNLVTMNGSAAWDAGSGRVFVLMGAQVNGFWTLPISNGQSSKSLSTCAYDNFGSDVVIYGKWVTPH